MATLYGRSIPVKPWPIDGKRPTFPCHNPDLASAKPRQRASKLSSRNSATELEEAEQSALEVIANGEKRRMPKHRMRGMKLSVPKSVDEYIAAQPEGVGRKLEQVRAAIRRAVPEADEHRLSPTGYKLYGKPM